MSNATPPADADVPPGVARRVSPAAEPLQDLVDHAQHTRVVVIGGGIAGLVAAWECAKVGMSVTLVEASDRLGGTIGSARLAGFDVETGVTCWSTRGGAVRRLVDEVLPGAAIVTPRDDREWIAGLPKGAAAPLPPEQVLGIPANPWDESVRRIIGWDGTWRAYVDRLRPPLTIGAQRSLGRLVRSRMGAKVRDRLVAPLTVDRFGLGPDEVDVEIAAPGLSNALTRTGWLGGAVADVRVGAGGPAIEGLDGGMPQLVAALAQRLVERGAAVHTGARATALVRGGDGWTVGLATPKAAAVSGAQPSTGEPDTAEPDTAEPAGAPSSAAAPGELQADAVIVATDEAVARALLASALDAPAFADAVPAGIAREVVTLVVDAPELDAAPRGAQVHAVPGALRATGLVHETARWAWLARAVGAGRHILRVSFGGPGVAPATAALSDADATALAVAEASALLGVRLDRAGSAAAGSGGAGSGGARVVDAHRDAFTLAPPASALGHGERTSAVRAAVTREHGIAAVGAWLSGSGLAQVVGDAREETDRLRRRVLWGASAPE
ncbi:protoporphyrinogen oxidase [Microbacterium yannicii]|uniref:Protoporphyrinogen oxidase n=1 Tax=Microbacterium yannicii TaxID=671622 RepID=A0ABP9LW88_9MICO|nr:FAD-dependent oxidoreductase [Microbacterium yannicii]MCO5954140.1 FAD-dependent oxidoreductase [Microbacterium yannicii]